MDTGAESYRRYLEGDEEGFVEIVRDYKDGLIYYLSGLVGDFAVAEDLTEDTFVKLGVKRPRLTSQASFKTWLYTIGRNLALDYLRRQKRHPSAMLEEADIAAAPGTSPSGEDDIAALEREYLREEQKQALNEAMKELKPEYRQVLDLQYFENFSMKEIAHIMKKTTHGVENLSYLARKDLRARLERRGIRYEDL